VFFAKTFDRATAHGYSDARTLIIDEGLPPNDIISAFHIYLKDDIWVAIQTVSNEGATIWWSIEGIGVPLLVMFKSGAERLTVAKGPETAQCRRRVDPVREMLNWNGRTGKSVAELVHFLMDRKSADTRAGALADDFCKFATGFPVEDHVHEPIDRNFGRIPEGDCLDLIFFGEARKGSTPRGYDNSAALISRERIPQRAVVKELWVFAGRLNHLANAPVCHQALSHWWVVFRDSDDYYWSAENVRLLLIQRLGDWEDRFKIKPLWATECQDRPGKAISRGIWQVLTTAATHKKTVRDVVDWMKSQSKREYDLLENNCQDFASALSKFLSGKTPTRSHVVTLAAGAARIRRSNPSMASS
jgi:hypothetical protein